MKRLGAALPLLDMRHPLARGLVLDVPFTEGRAVPHVLPRRTLLTHPSPTTVVWEGDPRYGVGSGLNLTSSCTLTQENADGRFAGGPLTIEAWFIKRGNTGAKQNYVAFASVGGNKWSLEWYQGDNKFWAQLNGSYSYHSVAVTPVTGDLYHLVATLGHPVDGVTVYLNGAPVAAQANSTTAPPSSTSDLIIGDAGGDGITDNTTFFGFRFWNRNLVASEVARLYQDPNGLYWKPRASARGVTALPGHPYYYAGLLGRAH